MIKKNNFKIILLIFFLLYPQSVWAEKYRLACKIGAFNLEGTAFQDKTRFYNKVMDFDVDTEVGIYSPDLRASSDEVIIHGLWPDAKLIQPFGSQELSWNNELLINDGSDGGEWVKYKYTSFVKKKTSRNKANERMLNITIQDYRLNKKSIDQKVSKLMEIKKKQELDQGKISQEEFDKWKESKENPNPENTPKKVVNTFKFEFKCTKSSV